MEKVYLFPRPPRAQGNDRFWPSVPVIAPLRFKVDSGTCICEGNGLFHCIGDGICETGYGFDADFHNHLPLLEPLRTETGKVRVLQPKIEENVDAMAYWKGQAYWKAQCVFRNLPWTGTVEDLQQRLQSSGQLEMHDDVAKLGEKLKEEFWEKNAVAQKEMWDRLETNEKKLYANAGWCLTEAFSKPEVHVLTVKVLEMCYEKDQIHSAVKALDLCHDSMMAPSEGEQGFMIWVVFGRNKSIVTEEMQRLRSIRIQKQQILLEAQAERTRILHETVVSEATADDAYWDVGGLWALSSPSLVSRWHLTHQTKMSLDIRFAQNRRWGRQMWAKFKFVSFDVVLRFMKPKPDSDNSNEESSDFENDDEDFYLDVVDHWPSPKCSKWDYAWRGIYDHEVFLNGKGKHCSLTFSGVGGTTLDGWFQSDPTGIIEFTGVKIGASPHSPSAEWEIIDFKWRELEDESML